MYKSLSALSFSLAFAPPALANIDILFDYSYDTGNFFTGNEVRKNALESAASIFESRFTDSLSAISSFGPNSFNAVFFNPSDPFGSDITLNSQSVAADVIRIYVGGANLGSSTLGLGGPGGYGCSGVGSFCTDTESRGQGATSGANPIDFAPWGGAISFDSVSTNWRFGTTNSGLDTGEFDFYSVAVHELAHVLGFGTAESFNALVTGSNFVGATAGTVALDGDQAHWLSGTLSTFNGLSQEAAMDPTIVSGIRKNFTDLDFAAMQDIGWQVTPVPEASSWVMMLAGLGMVGSLARRRSRVPLKAE